MQIIDMTEAHEADFFCCLEDWSDEAKEAGPRRSEWYRSMQERGLRVKLATDDEGTVGGMIQYAPIESTHVEGEGLYFVYCIWVHGYKKGRGNYQKQGMGKALLAAAENDVRALEGKGLVVWGIRLPFWMKASWFRKQGYRPVDRDGVAILMWKPFTDNAEPPRWIKQKKKPVRAPGKVTVTSFVNGWCMAQNIVHERAKRAVGEFGDQVEHQVFDTFSEEVFEEWGIVDALYIDGKRINTGPPPSYEKIRKKIARRIKAVSSAR